jgi:hypothetical protein
MFQLICEPFGVLFCLLFRKMHIAFSSSTSMEISIFLTWASSSFWDNFYIVAWGSFHSRGADVGSTSSTSAVGAITMVASNAFTDNFTVDVSRVQMLSVLERKWVEFGALLGRAERTEYHLRRYCQLLRIRH